MLFRSGVGVPRKAPPTFDPSVTARTWVLLSEAIEGGWGLAGHANTNAELVDAARAQIAELQKAKGAGA